jgi:hypothetical protein
MDINAWFNEVSALLERLKRIDLGYPLGENVIHPAPTESIVESLIAKTGLPRSSSIPTFYRRCNGLSLPDVHVGYFVHGVELILDGLAKGEPTRVMDHEGLSRIIVVGTDGGGGRFASRMDVEDIVYLPVGAVHDSVFDGKATPIRRLASNFPDFLELLLGDLRALVNNVPDWKYMV